MERSFWQQRGSTMRNAYYGGYNMSPSASFFHEERGEFVAVIDMNVGCSVTNNAEEVVEFVLDYYSTTTKRIFYRDTMGNWDEMTHDGEKFVGFKSMPRCFQLSPTEEK